ncbi:MAG TPA: sugar transferase [Acidimicrobiales bacterium]|nr:sugar transferase [Acidimicrobiales bacterium]
MGGEVVGYSPWLCGPSPGGVFFRQERVGREGERFTIRKFRTMVDSAEDELAYLVHLSEHDGLLFKLRNDPRRTRVGCSLRRFSLDELPHLWHVVTGHMSLVGPRPPLPSEVEHYGDDVRRRLLVKPGLTGLWQVSGRANLAQANVGVARKRRMSAAPCSLQTRRNSPSAPRWCCRGRKRSSGALYGQPWSRPVQSGVAFVPLARARRSQVR